MHSPFNLFVETQMNRDPVSSSNRAADDELLSDSLSDELIGRLASDRAFAVEYLQKALSVGSVSGDLSASLVVLRHLVDGCGGVGAVARAGGGSRPSLYRALSAEGNPTLRTFVALLKSVGLKLSVEEEEGPPPRVLRLARGRRPHGSGKET